MCCTRRLPVCMHAYSSSWAYCPVACTRHLIGCLAACTVPIHSTQGPLTILGVCVCVCHCCIAANSLRLLMTLFIIPGFATCLPPESRTTNRSEASKQKRLACYDWTTAAPINTATRPCHSSLYQHSSDGFTAFVVVVGGRKTQRVVVFNTTAYSVAIHPGIQHHHHQHTHVKKDWISFSMCILSLFSDFIRNHEH